MISSTSGSVLLVEDDPNDVLLIQRAFTKANLPAPMQVLDNGEAAVLYLSGQDPYRDRHQHPLPSLVLLDLKLPCRSGHEVLAWLRQQPELKRLPVIVLTSSQEMGDVNRAYDLGANSYLVKPVAFNALLDIVKMLDLYWMNLNQAPTLAHD
ncbi:response regulator [Trichocoleus sp. FACHB-591]|uniref:response regulator n=1 Tax=Trichocoleus TaxID=450526 RepID=UPI0016867126|nr:response regulator [Trichocoleus sp. FACHB-591]MBD2097951.1 response regulator [Trichocoleus sp. FACHB-591]